MTLGAGGSNDRSGSQILGSHYDLYEEPRGQMTLVDLKYWGHIMIR